MNSPLTPSFSIRWGEGEHSSQATGDGPVVELRLPQHTRRSAGTEKVLQLFYAGRVMVLSAEWGDRSQATAGGQFVRAERAEQILRAQRQDLGRRPCKVAGLCEFFSQCSR